MFRKIYLMGLLLALHSASAQDTERFRVYYEWSYVNFSWPSLNAYQDAITKGKYVPENNFLTGVKIYGETMFVSLPRARPGTPVTLAAISMKVACKTNPLLAPYPSWEMNQLGDCNALQNVQSMEIDSNGIMWVLDGTRRFGNIDCPPKIILLDLKNGGKVIQKIETPEGICPSKGCFLNDIVIDESDGGFAYISEHSSSDPGLVVFSRKENKLWKARDKSMFAEVDAKGFTVGGHEFKGLGNVDGIALEPQIAGRERLVYYCALTGYNLYAISTTVLKNESLFDHNNWRREIKLIGKKSASSDGLIVDNKGNLFLTFLDNNSVGKWNTSLPYNEDTVQIYSDGILWPDTFAFDDSGYLYVTATQVHKYFDPNYKLNLSNDTKLSIFRIRTNTGSYLFP